MAKISVTFDVPEMIMEMLAAGNAAVLNDMKSGAIELRCDTEAKYKVFSDLIEQLQDQKKKFMHMHLNLLAQHAAHKNLHRV